MTLCNLNLRISVRPLQMPLFHCDLEVMTMYKEVQLGKRDLMSRQFI